MSTTSLPPLPSDIPPFPTDTANSPWAQLFELVPAMVAYYSREGVICRFANANYAQMYGLSARTIVGKSAEQIMGSAGWNRLQLNLERAVSGESQTYTRDHVDPDGELRNIEVHLIPHQDAQGKVVGAFLFMTDITDLRQRELEAQARVDYLVDHDPLTELPRPSSLAERLKALLVSQPAPQEHVALMFLDLDHFQSINDSLGRSAGDSLLRLVADRLRSCTRPCDMLTRLGGDQFLVVITGIRSRVAAKSWATQLMQAIRVVVTVQGEPVSLTPSIGVSMFPSDGHDAETLLRHADAAMHRAKSAGRGRIRFYEPQMAPPGIEILQKERLLRDAVEQGSFEVHYQPQVRLSDGKFEGLEALVRWRHPEEGLLSPGSFIDLAEARSLIGPIARWVLNECCSQIKKWREIGLPPVRIAINVSALEFQHRNLLTEVPEALRQFDIEPRWLELELTESVMMRSSPQEMDTLSRLKAMGVGVAIDDFGTGYASLSYVRDYPADTLKIDRSFTDGIIRSDKDRAIVMAVLELAKGLNLRSVAEGVQSVEQMDWLRTHGCDLAQGHGISPPLNAQEIFQWMQQHYAQTPAQPLAPSVPPKAAY